MGLAKGPLKYIEWVMNILLIQNTRNSNHYHCSTTGLHMNKSERRDGRFLACNVMLFVILQVHAGMLIEMMPR